MNNSDVGLPCRRISGFEGQAVKSDMWTAEGT